MGLPRRVTAAVLAASLLALPGTASVTANAAPFGGALSTNVVPGAANSAPVILVQQRFHHQRRGGGDRGHHGGGSHGNHGGNHGGGGGNGGAIAAGVIGGLLLGAVIANQAQQNRGVDYCMQRFRSYDPRSGTYLGNDGYRHACP